MTSDVTLRPPHILVGVDGSACGEAALQWAADYAHRTGGSIELSTAWQWPALYSYPMVLGDFDLEGAATEVVDKAKAELTLPAERITTSVHNGAAAQVLVEGSEHADLLVVGSRGHGGFSGLLLGSVSTHCVHHALCPVVVVRPKHEPATT